MIIKNLKDNKGYTIIETMIAISLFLIAVTIGMGALLNANLIHNQSQNTRSIMDNLSFIMDDMSRNLRTGFNYHCVDDGDYNATSAHSCLTDGKGISFQQSTDGSQWVYGILSNGSSYEIKKSTDGGNNFISLNPSEVQIDGTKSSFIVTGAEPGDGLQPFVTIKLVGSISYKGVAMPFSLQTSVSQRLLDR